MKKNLIPLLGIAFIAAILSTGVFYGLFVTKLRASPQPLQNLVAAARLLERGTVLKTSDVKLVSFATANVPKGAFATREEVAGFTVTESIQENEPVTQARVGSGSTGSGAGLGIAKGMRAVSVHVSDSAGVLALLRPSSKVDVQMIWAPGGRQNREVDLKTILQNIEVLTIQNQTEASGRVPGQSPVVTLVAKPAEADMLALADSSARVRLTLRNSLDEVWEVLPVINAQSLFSARVQRRNSMGPVSRAGTLAARKQTAPSAE